MSVVTNYGTVIDYQNGRVICEDQFGELYFFAMPEEFANAGEVINLEALYPITILDQEEQEKIRTGIAELPEEYLRFIREGMVI